MASCTPIRVVLPAEAAPGERIYAVVELNSPTPRDQAVTIAGSAGAFSSLPSTVVVPVQQRTVGFPATLSPNATGAISVTATCNNVSRSGSLTIVSPEQGVFD
jgi:hypothetical protein